MLTDLIRGKNQSARFATATPATFATLEPERGRTVATVATVAVATATEAKVSPRSTATFDREWFEERAAIYEFYAGFPRHVAERLAMLEVTKHG